MPNPLQQPVGGPNPVTAPSNPQNLDALSLPKTHNPFNLTRPHYTTEQFGLYNPFRCIQVTPGDHFPIGVTYDVNSETLKSPFLSELHKKHDYFYIPMQAIMRHTWDYIDRNPSQGDDVPADANCFINDFPTYLKLMLRQCCAFFNQSSAKLTSAIITKLLRYLMLVESMTSSGSILSRMGYNYSAVVSINGTSETLKLSHGNIDDFFDVMYSTLLKNINVTIQMYNVGEELSYTTNPDNINPSFELVTPSVMISLLRQHRDTFTVQAVQSSQYIQDIITTFGKVSSSTIDNRWSVTPDNTNTSSDRTFNLAPVISYNLCCAQYFVNPKVDYIYNAELYTETIKGQLLAVGIINADNMMFPYNGHSITYDVWANHYMQEVFKFFSVGTHPDNIIKMFNDMVPYIEILENIFTLQTSLYYADYFTGCRPTPIGVGDSEYALGTSSPTIDMITLARKQMLARYLYTVGRIGNDAQDQRDIISGSYATPDIHFPQFVGTSDGIITGFQVGNTGDVEQGNQVTRLDTSDNTFATTIDISQKGYILAISSFYMPRCYSKTKDRHFFQRDRFDQFNEMLQFGGDQELFQAERNDNIGGTYGYHSDCEEYKQTFPQASGAFRDHLATWAYVVDADTIYTSDVAELDVISPTSIRVLPSEFDVFMQKMPYLSLGHNFHFIVKYSVNTIANRQMISSPNIF